MNSPNSEITVVVGLSGGVDSSVTAHLLKEQGYQVLGLFMRNWVDESVTIHDECPWVEDSNDAMLVADTLGIPFQVIDMSASYQERIVDYMFSEYEKGRTPNPDVLCNREIKFDLFLKTALSLGADYVATGHYVRKNILEQNGKQVVQLLSGADKNKDQSYFLCQLSQEQLKKALFPIGDLKKSQVREIAKEAGLSTAEKKDSQGLCFIGKVRLPDFLQQKLHPKSGNVWEIPSDSSLFDNDRSALESAAAPHEFHPKYGFQRGRHNGAHYYTVGQRKGLNIGGSPKPLFVLGVNTAYNAIYVGQGEDHPGLYRTALKIENKDIHWVREDLCLSAGESACYSGRIRYRQPLVDITLHQKEDALYMAFDTPEKAITPGQFAAWYLGDELIGSGTIAH
ncbi:tRNA 2-thiouridine(34) synthase MnmA [Schleiferiaceae bacterium]|nr:tRNA 2-thiouridine(34) synthase MnmA [Schleiferiaceae bacterium]|tara:strand:- start:1067 stop:2254 length:1188 start_codon:yes stop_codon:yes gene_type:complete